MESAAVQTLMTVLDPAELTSLYTEVTGHGSKSAARKLMKDIKIKKILAACKPGELLKQQQLDEVSLRASLLYGTGLNGPATDMDERQRWLDRCSVKQLRWEQLRAWEQEVTFCVRVLACSVQCSCADEPPFMAFISS